jgi:hypothetical protein
MEDVLYDLLFPRELCDIVADYVCPLRKFKGKQKFNIRLVHDINIMYCLSGDRILAVSTGSLFSIINVQTGDCTLSAISGKICDLVQIQNNNIVFVCFQQTRCEIYTMDPAGRQYIIESQILCPERIFDLKDYGFCIVDHQNMEFFNKNGEKTCFCKLLYDGGTFILSRNIIIYVSYGGIQIIHPPFVKDPTTIFIPHYNPQRVTDIGNNKVSVFDNDREIIYDCNTGRKISCKTYGTSWVMRIDKNTVAICDHYKAIIIKDGIEIECKSEFILPKCFDPVIIADKKYIFKNFIVDIESKTCSKLSACNIQNIGFDRFVCTDYQYTYIHGEKHYKQLGTKACVFSQNLVTAHENNVLIYE